jgi:phage-related protein
MKFARIQAEFPDLAGIKLTDCGEATTVRAAISRAVAAIFEHPELRSKRIGVINMSVTLANKAALETPLDNIEVFTYPWFVTSPGSESRIRWCGDSNVVIRDWPEGVRFNIGGDLDRLDNRQEPLDFGPMGHVLPAVYELRDRDSDCWYRVLYIHLEGLIYVLHCFTKTTNQTAQSDIKTARDRLTALEREIAERKKEMKRGGKGKR